MCWKVIFDKFVIIKNVMIYFSFNVKNVKWEIFWYFSVICVFCLKKMIFEIINYFLGWDLFYFICFGKLLVKK